MSTIPHDDALLTRAQLAAALTEHGFKTSKATLATWASRKGNGPPYRLYGCKPLYKWGDAILWAKSRLSPPCRSTAEHDARRAAMGR